MLALDYSLSEITPDILIEIYESAQYECEYDDDDNPTGAYVPKLQGLFTIVVSKSNLIKFFANKYSSNDLDAIQVFCRSVNDSMHLIKLSFSDTKDEDGDYRVSFAYDLLVYEPARISPELIIKVAREIDEFIGYAIEQHDTHSIFKYESDK